MTAVLQPTSETQEWRNPAGAGRNSRKDRVSAAKVDTAQESKTPATSRRRARPANADDRISEIADTGRSRRAALLSRVVEAEILPRLALARVSVDGRTSDGTLVTTAIDTDELVRLLLSREAEAAIAFVEVFRIRGASAASLYLGIVTDAARVLGRLWEDDRCDFTQVTIGLGRLQQLVRALSPSFQIAAVTHAHPETILLTAAPGDQHTLGLVILSEFFQREGWHVIGGPATSGEEVADMVTDTWVDVAGLSIGSTSRLDGLIGIIRMIRRSSRNRDISVMIGGPLLLLQPDLVARVGADVGAHDALTAVRQASGLIAMRTAAD